MMRDEKECFWASVPAEEKPGLKVLIAIAIAAMIFNLGVAVGKYLV